jgi:hypothetical protein
MSNSNTREALSLLVSGTVIEEKTDRAQSDGGGGTGLAGACRTASGSGNWGPELTGDVAVM